MEWEVFPYETIGRSDVPALFVYDPGPRLSDRRMIEVAS
jgi:hypothetical protein